MSSGFDQAVRFIQAATFLFVGFRATLDWVRSKAAPQAHLAVATGLWGAQSLFSAINSQVNGVATCAAPTPKIWAIVSSLLLLSALYAYLNFLRDFLRYPAWAHTSAVLISVGLFIMAILVKAPYEIDSMRSLKPIPCDGFSSADRSFWLIYLTVVLLWLIAVFAVLTVSFLRYGRRVRGLARFRMTAIGTGFLLLTIAVVVLSGGLSGAGGPFIFRIIQVLALGAAPALFFGFTPPAFIKKRYPE